MVMRLATPGPMVSKSTAGFESVVARMIFFLIRLGGSSSPMEWLGPSADFDIFFSGSSSPMTRAPTVGRRVSGMTNVSP